jgi:polysaccharide biosynthesis/export protein
MTARVMLLMAAMSGPGLFCQNSEVVSAKPSEAGSVVALATPGPDYVIGPSDVLSVTVWKEPGLTASLLVRPDGMISMPLVGDIAARGLRPLQLAEEITQKLKKYIQDPNVSIVLTQINSRKVFLLGEIAKRGPIEMTSGMRLIEAISSAGGLTDYANQKKIYILRSEGGPQQKISVRYKEALKGNNEFNVLLKPGDTIVVP